MPWTAILTGPHGISGSTHDYWGAAAEAARQELAQYGARTAATFAGLLAVDGQSGKSFHATDGELTLSIREEVPSITPGSGTVIPIAAEPDHGARAHCELGGSVAARFWNCSGSVRMSRGRPNRETAATRRGTAAHEVAELCMRQDQDAIEYVGRTVAGEAVDAEMADSVQVYLDECRRAAEGAAWHKAEVQFDLARFDPPAPMYGTADFVAFHAGPPGVLTVIDYKSGFFPVRAEGNQQLRFYALGAIAAFPESRVAYITVTIVQPQPNGLPSVQSETFDAIELAEWAAELMDRARATLAPDAPLHAGSWCKFCPAADCAEQARYSLETARLEFGALEPEPPAGAAVMPPDPATLTPDQIAAILDRAPEFTAWLKAVQEFAAATIEAGGDVPGWKQVETWGKRQWRDPSEAAAALFVADVDAYAPAPLISPAQAREAMARTAHQTAAAAWEKAGKPKGQKPTLKACQEAAAATVRGLTFAASSGRALVRATDPRPAEAGGGREFDALPAESADSDDQSETEKGS